MNKPDISLLQKRDDYSLRYMDNISKLNIQLPDPDVNPIFLAFLLSLVLLVLLACIFISSKLLEIEREKEYVPEEDNSTKTIELRQNGLWTMTKKLGPNFKVDNTNSLMPPPKTQNKFNLDENSGNHDTVISEEYRKLKQQLESAPDSYRESFMSYASTEYKRKSTRTPKFLSISDSTTRESLTSDYGEVLTTHESNDELYGEDSITDHRASKMTIETEIEEPSTFSYLKSAVYGNQRKSIDTKKTSDTDSMHSRIMPANSSSKLKSNRKSIIPSRMSTGSSIMSADSLL